MNCFLILARDSEFFLRIFKTCFIKLPVFAMYLWICHLFLLGVGNIDSIFVSSISWWVLLLWILNNQRNSILLFQFEVLSASISTCYNYVRKKSHLPTQFIILIYYCVIKPLTLLQLLHNLKFRTQTYGGSRFIVTYTRMMFCIT